MNEEEMNALHTSAGNVLLELLRLNRLTPKDEPILCEAVHEMFNATKKYARRIRLLMEEIGDGETS